MEKYKTDFQLYYNKHHREKQSALRRNILISSRVSVDRLGINQKYSKLLDIGCGTGELLKVCKERNISSFGLDISPEGLLMAKQDDVKNLVLGDQETLPFQDNSFDYLTLISILEYSLEESNIKKALEEVKRVSGKNAKIYIEVRNGDFILFKILRLFSLAKIFISETYKFKRKKNTIKARRYKDLSYRQWNEILDKCGFKVEKLWKSYKPLSGVGFVYFIKTLFVNLLNLVIPISFCYRLCYLCKMKD